MLGSLCWLLGRTIVPCCWGLLLKVLRTSSDCSSLQRWLHFHLCDIWIRLFQTNVWAAVSCSFSHRVILFWMSLFYSLCVVWAEDCVAPELSLSDVTTQVCWSITWLTHQDYYWRRTARSQQADNLRQMVFKRKIKIYLHCLPSSCGQQPTSHPLQTSYVKESKGLFVIQGLLLLRLLHALN